MHILFLTDNFPPEVNAPASRTYEHAREWVAAGHQVTIVTCVPNFPQGKVYQGYRNKVWQMNEMDGIKVIRVWSFITANEGFIKRILDYQSFMVSSFLASLVLRKIDVVVGTSPQFFTVCAAWAVATIKRKPFVFELRDIWPESVRAVGAMKESRVLDLLEKVEVFLYRRATRIISVTHSFKRTLIERGIDGEKIDVITNGVDSKRFVPMTKDAELVAELDVSGCFVAGYIGTHGMAHALDTLLDAAVILQNDVNAQGIRLMFLGDGANRDALISRAEQLGLSNVVFRASVPKEQVQRYWSVLDVSIIHLRKNELFKTVIPSKMFECMGMGLPILLGVEGESAEIVQRTGVGVSFPPEDGAALAQSIKRLRDSPERLKSMASAGEAGAVEYDRKVLAQRMLLILAGLDKR